MKVYPVTAEREDRLEERMARLGVSESDLDESFVRSGGHGGQNVNKTSTCVQLVHRPTGMSVKCQTTRQQGMNRFLARQMLLDKIEDARRIAAAEERARIEKVRRQKRPRSRGAKERILASKSRQASKKRLRARPDGDRD
ncbi:MAG: peptide chain release factor-like protein [Limisphaerales bacterium]